MSVRHRSFLLAAMMGAALGTGLRGLGSITGLAPAPPEIGEFAIRRRRSMPSLLKPKHFCGKRNPQTRRKKHAGPKKMRRLKVAARRARR